MYVEALLQVHTRYSQLVSMAFEGKPMFVGALDKVSSLREESKEMGWELVQVVQ